MAKNAAGLKGKKINVGVPDGEQSYIAKIHEYGVRIPVTDKMRAYLAARGLPLKKTTTEIVIPERSFLRSGYDENKDAVFKKASFLLGDVLDGTMKPEELCEIVGDVLASKIREYATALDSPPNHPFTAAEKGSSNPLSDTGQMIGSITYEVEG